MMSRLFCCCCSIILLSWTLILTVYAESSESKVQHRIAFGSCYNPNKGDDIWQLIGSFSPNQLILLGDQIYADFHPTLKYKRFNGSSPGMMEEEYEKLYKMPGFLDLVSSLSHGFLSTYDDHDYGKDNGDRTFKFRQEAIDLFAKYNRPFHFQETVRLPSLSEPSLLVEEKKSGVFSSHDYSFPLSASSSFRYRVLLLDGRSNKDVKGSERGDFLGEQQWRWLRYELSSERLKDIDLLVIGSGIQILSDDKLVEESWGEFPERREELLKELGRVAFETNLVLLSGDIHCAEVSQMRCFSKRGGGVREEERRLMEVTSSGLSHTFSMIMDTDSMSLQTNPNPNPSNPSNPRKILVKSRSYVAEFFSMAYQLVYPAVYREDKVGDVFQGIHFALLSFYLTPPPSSTTTTTSSSQVKLVFEVKNHEGVTVIAKELSLSARPLEEVGEVRCEPIQGPLSPLQFQWFKANLVIGAMVFILLPVVTLLWFLGAALYYLFVGKELERRDRIERIYQLHQQQQREELAKKVN